jgi:hypothetical protein
MCNDPDCSRRAHTCGRDVIGGIADWDMGVIMTSEIGDVVG